jgi:hypothetical protein
MTHGPPGLHPKWYLFPRLTVGPTHQRRVFVYLRPNFSRVIAACSNSLPSSIADDLLPILSLARAYKKASTPSLFSLLSPSQRSRQADNFLRWNPPLLPPCLLRFSCPNEVAPPLFGLYLLPKIWRTF